MGAIRSLTRKSPAVVRAEESTHLKLKFVSL
jgi:hypothetical protein